MDGHKGRDFRKPALAVAGAIILLVFFLPWFWGKMRASAAREREGTRDYEGLKRLQERCLSLLPPEEGTALVMDPRDGKVLVVTNPDWALRMRFPPGSTFKLLAALAAIKAGQADASWTVTCPGYYVYQGETLDCSHAHGEVNFTKGIANSCNTYFYALGQRLGWEPIADCARSSGLGTMTGINLPGEVPGEIPRALSKRQAVDFSIGEGGWIQVTPVGMAVFVSSLARGGKRFVPQAIPDRESFQRFRHHPADPLVLPPGLSLIREGMREAVEHGTCVEAKLPRIAVAGKTGTATAVLGGGVTHSWFLGFAPFDHPRYVVVVFNKRGLGQVTSAPLGGKILEACFETERK